MYYFLDAGPLTNGTDTTVENIIPTCCETDVAALAFGG